MKYIAIILTIIVASGTSAEERSPLRSVELGCSGAMARASLGIEVTSKSAEGYRLAGVSRIPWSSGCLFTFADEGLSPTQLDERAERVRAQSRRLLGEGRMAVEVVEMLCSYELTLDFQKAHARREIESRAAAGYSLAGVVSTGGNRCDYFFVVNP